MGHCRQLLDSIAEKVLIDYPAESGFEIEFETYLKNIPYRMEPDIWVHRDDEVICVVEIGYTRPEKLTRYKEIGVPDIRWYSKEGELHVRHTGYQCEPMVPAPLNPPHQMGDDEMVTANHLRSMLITAIHGVMSGRINVAKANAIASLSGELHKSIDQEWNMRVYAAENLQLSNDKVVRLLAN